MSIIDFAFQMASEDGGFDCEFVSPPPKVLQVECSVCLLILRVPHLTSCCGHNFCRVCIERIQNYGKPCPLCKEDKFTTLRNKGLERALNELAVQCAHKGSGCSWSDELGALDYHLSMACPFVEVECRHDNCHHIMKRRDVSPHEASCGFRPFCCNWCQEYATWYDDVKDNHWPVCPKYPVSCNQCKAIVERQHLLRHIEKDCPFTVVDCEFSSEGCKTRLPRVDLQGHLTAEQLLHLTMVNRKLFNETAILSKRISDLEVRGVGLKTEMEKMAVEKKELETKMALEVAQLTVKVSNQKRQLDALEKAVECYIRKEGKLNMVPVKLEVSKSLIIPRLGEVQLASCDFYSKFGGYKIQIQLYGKSEGFFLLTDICMRLTILAGQFDDILQWPFNGTVVIQVQSFADRVYIDFKNMPKLTKGEKCGRYISHRLISWDEASEETITVTVEQVIIDTE